MDANNAALQAALKKLRAADWFEAELRGFLASFPAEEVESAISFLRERRMIDDSRTARNLVERSTGKKARGSDRLRQEMLDRGAPAEIVEEALAEQETDERERMHQALAAKFRPEDSRAKAGRFLASKGFDEDAIEGALDRYFESSESSD
jgi:SOS response regulatory protein OraA/RecX